MQELKTLVQDYAPLLVLLGVIYTAWKGRQSTQGEMRRLAHDQQLALHAILQGDYDRATKREADAQERAQKAEALARDREAELQKLIACEGAQAILDARDKSLAAMGVKAWQVIEYFANHPEVVADIIKTFQ